MTVEPKGPEPQPKYSTASPSDLYGPLLARVQESRILNDGKTFVDAEPRRPVAEIMADFAALPPGDDALRSFIAANFILPPAVKAPVPAAPKRPLRAHIRAMWTTLARDPQTGAVDSSALPVGHRHAVPGGRFREIYYWDSFFTMLGLVRDGETELANGIVDALTDMIEEHGHVPNGSRTYYLGRSQPPLFHMMVSLLDDRRAAVVRRRLSAMKQEHAWWMDGAIDLAPGEVTRRVARLSDGSLLNRYWDPRDTPRDESWHEDVETAAASNRMPVAVYRELRAGAESGWDFSSRWLGGIALATIRTTAVAPVDLNAFLFGLERAISDAGDADAAAYAERARLRCDAMRRHMWDDVSGHFCDYDLERSRMRPALTAAALAPLLAGVATKEQADATAAVTAASLLAAGGLRTTLVRSGQQWDFPNGWAPLQWIAITGLRRYGHEALASEIASRWIATVDTNYNRTGLVFEKYDVEAASVGEGGEYAPQTGFGWTNGVTADLIDEYIR